MPPIQQQNAIAGQNTPFAFSEKDLPAGLSRNVVTLDKEELLDNTQLSDSEFEAPIVQFASQLVEDEKFTEQIGRESMSDHSKPKPVANPITNPTSEPVSENLLLFAYWYSYF